MNLDPTWLFLSLIPGGIGFVLFFCTDWSRFVTGTYLPVCGGTQMN